MKATGFKLIPAAFTDPMTVCHFIYLFLLSFLVFLTCSSAKETDFKLDTVYNVSSMVVFPAPAQCKGNQKNLLSTVAAYYKESLLHDGVLANTSARVVELTEVWLKVNTLVNIDGLQDLIHEYNYVWYDQVAARNALVKANHWNSSWRILPSLGFPMLNPKALQILHFPPVSVICKRTSYNSSTVDINMALMKANLGDKGESAVNYVNFKNIFPVALPASEGSHLNYTLYKAFNTATMNQFQTVLDRRINIPVVFYGEHVKEWVRQVYGIELQINTVGMIKLTADSPEVWYTHAHHPSNIYHHRAVDKIVEIGTSDLRSACWLVKVSQAGNTANPREIMQECVQMWQESDNQVCILLVQLVWKVSEEKAAEACSKRGRKIGF